MSADGEQFQTNVQEVAIQRDRLDQLSQQTSKLIVTSQALASRKDVEGIIARLDSPEVLLRNWIATNAIFFADGTDFEDSKVSSKQLTSLAELLLRTKHKLRVIGHSDGAGSQSINRRIATARADLVRAELTMRGVPKDRVSVVGMGATLPLNSDADRIERNRRAEFEIAFSGE